MIELIHFSDVDYNLQMQTRLWRNCEQVVPYFKIKHIDEAVHKKWLESLKVQNPRNVAFLIVYEGVNVGVTYFHSIDYEKKCADWGMYIYLADYKGKGIGMQTLEKCIAYAKDVLKMKCLYLDVLATNERAVRLYEKCGFRFVEKEEDNFLRYKLDL